MTRLSARLLSHRFNNGVTSCVIRCLSVIIWERNFHTLSLWRKALASVCLFSFFLCGGTIRRGVTIKSHSSNCHTALSVCGTILPKPFSHTGWYTMEWLPHPIYFHSEKSTSNKDKFPRTIPALTSTDWHFLQNCPTPVPTLHSSITLTPWSYCNCPFPYMYSFHEHCATLLLSLIILERISDLLKPCLLEIIY